MAAVLSTAVAASTARADVVHNGVVYGDAEPLAGVYFTNFENSTFVLCNQAKGECSDWADARRSYGMECEPAACAELEARIKALNGSHDNWGLYAVTFLGRRSVGPDHSRWLGDPTRKVLAVRIRSVTLLEKH